MSAPGRFPHRAALRYVAGFVVLAMVIWLSKLLDLPHHLLGADPSRHRLEELLLETVAILVLGTLVVAWIRPTIRRVAYLERYIVLCSWCRRVNLGAEWLPLEAFLGRHESETSHGMCPACAAKFEEESVA